jgi:hypothetical protein
MTVTVLFFGDVVGALGRQALAKALPGLKRKFSPVLTIANAENLAHGAGVTEQTLNELVKAGVDAFTGGSHSWSNPLGMALFGKPEWKDRLAVPTNSGLAKNGSPAIVRDVDGKRILVLSIEGQLFTDPNTRSPFETLDRLLAEQADPKPDAVIVDLHAEATAEKEAFGHHADGRVAAVIGTHTHVQTSDDRILPGGTGYLTDVGRCGSYDSVIGFEKNSAVKRYLSGVHGKYELEKTGKAEVDGVAIHIDLDTGRAVGLDRIREIIDA